MLGDLRPAVIRALVTRWGSTRNAAIDAMRRPEYSEDFRLIAARLEELPDGTVYPKISPSTEVAFWKLVATAALEGDELVAAELERAALSPRSRKSKKSRQGTWEGKGFSEDEVDKAAGIYMSNRRLTPWEAWVRYQRVWGLEDDGRLGREKVADLIAALDDDESDVSWDAQRARVQGLQRSSSEPQRVLIPRRKPSS